MNKIFLFKDQEDYIVKLSDDNIINIIGSKGSGKTTLSLKYYDGEHIVINCDRLLELPTKEKEDRELSIIRNILKKKYGMIKEEDFVQYYDVIINYILKKNKQAIIEGNVIQDIDIFLLKGTVIIKRTGAFKSFIRAVKRDYKNEYFMNKEKEEHQFFYKITRLYKIINRRKKIFKQVKDIEEIINKLEKNSYEME